MFFTVLLAIPSLIVLWLLTTYVEHLISLRKYPKGPLPLPLIGNLNLLSKKLFLDFIKLGKIYGDVFSLSFGMNRVVVINTYDKIKEALVTHGSDFAGRPTTSIPSKIQSNNFKSLASSDYSKSSTFMRKLAFKSMHLYGTGLKRIEEVIIEEVDKMCHLLGKEIKKPVLIHQYLGNSLVNTICHICFSKKYEADDEEFQQILKFTRLINIGLGPGQPISIFPWLRYFPDSEKFKNLKMATKLRNAHTHRMFNEHIETFNPEKIRDVTDNILYLSQNRDLWIDAGFEEVNQDQLESIINSLFFAGIETSLSTLRWFLIYLLHHPVYQNKMYDEIVSKFGFKHQISFDDSRSLPLVQAVLLETLRLASITPVNVPHKTTVDTSVSGFNIPKGTQIFFNLYSMHYDEKYWDKPHQFNPERWLNTDGNLKTEKASHYLPFSGGPRVCIGKKMAKTQMFLVVTKLLMNFEISPDPDEPLPEMKEGILGLTYEPATKFKIILTHRKH